MADYKFYALFTSNKVGKPGITVTIDVYKSADDSLVVNNAAANEIAGGLYSYIYQTSNRDDYIAVFKTADTTVDQQNIPAMVSKEQILIVDFGVTVDPLQMTTMLTNAIPTLVNSSTSVTAIKAKTDNLPSSPAASGEYTTALTAIQADLDNPAQYKADVSGLALETTAQAIKAKTDTITTPPTTAQIADAVWTRTTRTVTNTIPSAATIANSVWSAATRTLTTAFPTPPTAAQIATAVWAETVRTLTSYPTQLTQADIRQAVGLIAANLDSQLAGLDTKIDNLPAPDNTGIAGIKAKTDQLTYTEGKVNANATIDASGLATEATLNAVKAKTDQLTFVNGKVDANATATVDTSGLATEATQQSILSMLSSDPLPVRIDGIVGSTITATRGNDWFIAIEGLTLDGKIQLAIKRNDNQPDDRSALFVDSATGLITLNGKPATDPTLASLTFSGGILTLSVDASVTAQLSAVSYRYGIQSVGGTVSEKYGGEFVVNADVVRATE